MSGLSGPQPASTGPVLHQLQFFTLFYFYAAEVICPALPPPFHGVIATKPPYKYEAKMEVSCEPGFNHSGYHHLQCMGNNSWTGNVGECYRECTKCSFILFSHVGN